MKAKEFAAMKPEELTAKIAELKEELFNLRMQITAVKRDIARAMTVQTQQSKA